MTRIPLLTPAEAGRVAARNSGSPATHIVARFNKENPSAESVKLILRERLTNENADADLVEWGRGVRDAFTTIELTRLLAGLPDQRADGASALRRWTRRLQIPLSGASDWPLPAYENHLLSLVARSSAGSACRSFTISHRSYRIKDARRPFWRKEWRNESVTVRGYGMKTEFYGGFRGAGDRHVQRLPPFPREFRAWLAGLEMFEARFELIVRSGHERAKIAAFGRTAGERQASEAASQ